MAIQVLTGPVVAHGGARVCVAGGDLDIPEVNTSVETGLAKVWRTMCGCTLVTWMPGVVPSFVDYSVAVEV